MGGILDAFLYTGSALRTKKISEYAVSILGLLANGMTLLATSARAEFAGHTVSLMYSVYQNTIGDGDDSVAEIAVALLPEFICRVTSLSRYISVAPPYKKSLEYIQIGVLCLGVAKLLKDTFPMRNYHFAQAKIIAGNPFWIENCDHYLGIGINPFNAKNYHHLLKKMKEEGLNTIEWFDGTSIDKKEICIRALGAYLKEQEELPSSRPWMTILIEFASYLQIDETESIKGFDFSRLFIAQTIAKRYAAYSKTILGDKEWLEEFHRCCPEVDVEIFSNIRTRYDLSF